MEGKFMVMRKSYTNEEKRAILMRAVEIGVAKAAKEYEMSYQTLLNWWKKKDELIGDQTDTVNHINEQIKSIQEEIDNLFETIKTKKTKLKELQKQKAKEEKEEAKRKEKEEKEKAKRKEAEEKQQLLNALLESDKSVDEILEFLNAE